jgi:transcription antitermination factor NusG
LLSKLEKENWFKQRILPGYLLVELAVPDDNTQEKKLYSDVVMTNGVSSFVGMREGVPLPVAQEELDFIFDRMGDVVKTKANLSKIAGSG